jgi:hypothetical protein
VRLGRPPCGDSFRFGEINVHFAAYSKLAFKVDAQAQSKTCTPHQAAIVLSFRIIDIRIFHVFFMNGMSGAMQEPFAIARQCDELMRRIIHLHGSTAERTGTGGDFRQVRLELLPGKIDFFFPGSASRSDYFTSLENEYV